MTRPLRTSRIFLYQFLSLGFYFFFWCNRLGRELSAALRRQAVPTMWWFAVPGGAYYWMWRMTESLDTATAGRIKQGDTFLLYLLLTGAGFGGISYLPSLPQFSYHATYSHTAHIHWHIVLVVLAIVVVVITLALIALHAVFMSIVQAKLNKLRGR